MLCHGWVSKQRHEIRAKVHWNVLGLSNDLWPKWAEEWDVPSSGHPEFGEPKPFKEAKPRMTPVPRVVLI